MKQLLSMIRHYRTIWGRVQFNLIGGRTCITQKPKKFKRKLHTWITIASATRRTVFLKYFVDQSIFQKRLNLVIVDVVVFVASDNWWSDGWFDVMKCRMQKIVASWLFIKITLLFINDFYVYFKYILFFYHNSESVLFEKLYNGCFKCFKFMLILFCLYNKLIASIR